MKKPDELYVHQATIATKFMGHFYSLSLLIWSIYNFIENNKLGIPFIIFSTGQFIFWFLLMKNQRKIKKLEKLDK
ncbi:hypothetical protein Q8G37_26635 [Bacillus wiedmannii]|uniref:hypothetical protein n=1 Tax=Bacillus wiedmannii TaxID=1890302 RepID=UPI002731D3A8|nr:hypothetical protein [Bacillus wiedmannii]MDP1459950.1 hypothetical protein [Bacillus wiedmannii]